LATFAQRLRYLRQKNKLTQKELGNRLGVSGPTVTRWEKGQFEPDMETTKKIADLFDVSIDYVLGVSDEETPQKKSPSSPFDLIKLKRHLVDGEPLKAGDKEIPEKDQKLFREVVLPILDRLIDENGINKQ
jgi:transcriptional regulator with XRE-family HTH domain